MPLTSPKLEQNELQPPIPISTMSERIPMTRAGYEKIKAELDHLHTVELPKILERIAVARSEGDLSENAEYQYSQESRLLMEAKIRDLQDKLSRAVFLDPSQISTDSISFGCTVKVKDLIFDDDEEFTLVGAGEDDPNNGKINVSSPLAQGLLGKKVGDLVEITVPQGLLKFKVLEIRVD
jgi:transcription elongation factor GreA